MLYIFAFLISFMPIFAYEDPIEVEKTTQSCQTKLDLPYDEAAELLNKQPPHIDIESNAVLLEEIGKIFFGDYPENLGNILSDIIKSCCPSSGYQNDAKDDYFDFISIKNQIKATDFEKIRLDSSFFKLRSNISKKTFSRDALIKKDILSGLKYVKQALLKSLIS